MRKLLLACTACVGLLGFQAAQGATYPNVQLTKITPTGSTAHPFLLTNAAQASAFLVAAQTDPGKTRALLRLAVSVKAYLANTSLLSSLNTPLTGSDLTAYMAGFSLSSTTGGAAQYALIFSYYAYLTSLNLGFGDPVLAAQAKAEANSIVYAWAATGFRIGGVMINSYQQFTESNADGTAAPLVDAWSDVNLQVGRGMLAFVVAQDLLDDGTQPAANTTVIGSFIAHMRDMLIGAANYHYSYSPYYDCHRYDNQASTGLTDLLALAWYSGDAQLINNLAGVPTTSPLLSWTWPQQVEASIYGNNDSARSCNTVTTVNDKYNPIAAAGEITDRERNNPYKPFGYTTGNVESLMQAGHMFKDLGFDGYHFTGPQGQNIQMALDYYSQYYASYASASLAYIPATGTIPDFAQYAGDVYTSATPGADVMGSDGLVWPYVIGNTIYPKDSNVAAALNNASTLGTAAYIPTSNPDIFSLIMWGSKGS